MTFHRSIALVIATCMPVLWTSSAPAHEGGPRRAASVAASEMNLSRANAYTRWKSVNRAGQVGINPQPLPPRIQ